MKATSTAVILAAGVLTSTACHLFHEDDLAERAKRRIHEVAPQFQVTIVDRNTLRIKVPEDVEATMSLDNLRTLCEQEPEECETALDNHVLTAVRVGDASTPTREQVRAVLKGGESMEGIERALGAGPPEKAAENRVVTRRFIADLWIVYVIDQPESMQMLSHGRMKELGLQEQEVHDLALANMSASLEPMASLAVPGAEGVFAVHVGDAYDASRLLLPDLWQPLREKTAGDLLACAPTRDVVLYTSSRPADHLQDMLRIARRIHEEGPYSLSTAVFKWTPSGFVLFRR